MRRIIGCFGAISIALILSLTGCSDEATLVAPEMLEVPAPFFSQEPAAGFDVLRRTKPLKKAERRSMVIGPRGGTITLKKAGLSLVVPRGALTTRTRITLAAPAGDAVAVYFAPHGLQFERRATVRLSLKGTNAGSAGFNSFLGVYFAGDVGASVTPLETFEAGCADKKCSFNIEHFSGYAVAGG